MARAEHFPLLSWPTGTWPLALAVVVSLVYFPCLSGDYIWDDRSGLMLGNPQMEAAWGWLENWYRPQTMIYEPVTFDSFWVQRWLCGENRAVFHATNVVIHWCNALLLTRLLMRLQVPGAHLAGLLFAIHPVAVESVAWIYERNNLLSVMWAMMSALAFLRWNEGKRAWYGVSLGLFAASLLSKSLTVMFPFVLLSYRWLTSPRRPRVGVLDLVPFFALSLAVGLVRWYCEQRYALGSQPVSDLAGGADRLLNAARGIWFYVVTFGWPVGLHMPYGRWSIETGNVGDWIPLLGLLVVAAACRWRWHQGGRPVALASGFFVLNLLPLLGLTENAYFQYSFVADRWQYFAMSGLAALAGWGAARPCMRSPGHRVAVRACGGVVAVALAAMSWRQAHVYQGMEAWCRHTLAHNPVAWPAHCNLGNLLLERGDLSGATAHLRTAFALRPQSPSIALNLGEALLRDRRLAEASDVYTRAVELQPLHPRLHYNRGLCAALLGQPSTARQAFEMVLQLVPGDPAAHDKLGILSAAEGRFERAIAHYQAAVDAAPGHPIYWFNLGTGYEAAGDAAQAAAAYGEAARLDAQYPEPRLRLAEGHLRRGEPQEASRWVEEVLERVPDHPDAMRLRHRLARMAQTPRDGPALGTPASSRLR